MYIVNLEQITLSNAHYRRVLHTSSNMQLVVMCIPVGKEIGMEVHDDVDQFIRVESGVGIAILDNQTYPISDGTGIVIPAGVNHNVINQSASEPLKLYTIYTPPEHPPNTIQDL